MAVHLRPHLTAQHKLYPKAAAKSRAQQQKRSQTATAHLCKDVDGDPNSYDNVRNLARESQQGISAGDLTSAKV